MRPTNCFRALDTSFTSRLRGPALYSVAIAVFVGVVLPSAWTDEDVWITLRAVDNFVHGYGLGWNAYERVQVFTHPLWMLVLSAAFYVTREGYFTTLAISFVCSVALFPVVWRRWRVQPWRVLAYAFALVSSKAFVDYTSSGLENPLTNLLATLFFVRLFDEERAPITERKLFTMVLLASLGYFNRADATLAYVPSLFWLTARCFRVVRFRIVRAWLLGTLPASLWTVFAVVYFGFPVPNTAFAKLAGGHYRAPFLHPNALAYYANSWVWDPVTLLVVVGASIVGFALAFRTRRPAIGLTLTGVLLLMVYALRIGGDYMSGRLFSLPYAMAALVLVDLVPVLPLLATSVLVFVVGLAGPRSPIRSRLDEGELRGETGILDDHRMHWRLGALKNVLHAKDYKVGFSRFAAPPPGVETQVIAWGATGYHGWVRGPMLRTIDFLALSDALLARLPPYVPALAWGRGHLHRPIPDGYMTSAETGQNRIVDPSLHAYYDKLLVITTGPLFTADRARTIWEMNTGKYTHYVDEYAARHPLP